ncbi:hypothetical protein MAHJHV58_35950 [Mycobacterium avium subsp. hominissuis]|uniref:Short chain dehydrogenase family protein n=1 Tax=Mycobacterium avium subsp. hominissuis TaxID=439334 RepID=A0AAI8SN73_MYCAV|nr:short chain dehydrogenase family protein [Mycobacterium avium MAV_120809_2495]ETZ66405.1 short chain dehydrogenase family protein [Mycobacterium sp. MAC_080597_8934]ETZ79750.1 short chain dehydrogenase family protein [Mycobacterium sp. MAC_011194_8550]KDP05214.1 hypothetical protein MAV100_18940 [Mycobacterium avium subsp. hominissuis 100]BBN49553.1 hypothetical protein JPH1_40280 [Mycobacterium avium subsp. hominissuis]
MTGRLTGRAAIVTGASRGLGRAIALALASEGAAVAVAGRTEQVWDDRLPGTIGSTVADIEAAGGRAVPVRADLTDRDDVARLVDSAREALGPITILVNNAAFTAPGRPPAPSVRRRQTGVGRRQTGLAGLRQHAAARLPAAFRHRRLRRLRADAEGVPRHDRGGRRSDHQHHLGRLPAAG